MKISIWDDIQKIIDETHYSASELNAILIRWQTNILRLLPSSVENVGTSRADISKCLYLLEKKQASSGISVLLETLRYLLIPERFSW